MTSITRLGPPADATPIETRARVDAAHQFEALVAGQLAATLLASVEESGSGGDAAAGMWQGIMAEAIGRDIARGSGLGLAAGVAVELARADGASA